MANLIALLRRKVRENLPYAIVAILLFLFLVAFLAEHIFITINAGEEGVLFRRFGGGTVIDEVYDEGLHVIAPWNKMTIYNLRIQEIAKEIQVLSKDGLNIGITVSLRFRPTRRLLGVLHKDHGPQYIFSFIFPELESSVRRVIGSIKPVELYSTNRDSVESEIDRHLHDELREFDELIYTEWPAVSEQDMLLPADTPSLHSDNKSENMRLLIAHIRDEATRQLAIERGVITLYDSLHLARDSLETASVNISTKIDRERRELLILDPLDPLGEYEKKRSRIDRLTGEYAQVHNHHKAILGTLDKLLEAYDTFFLLIDIHDVLVRTIKLPNQIEHAIQNKLEQEQIAEEFTFRLLREEREAERKRIEARGIRDFQKTVSNGIKPDYLKWKAIEATLELSKSSNAKVVIIGAGEQGLPIILGNQAWGESLPSGKETSADSVLTSGNSTQVLPP